MRQADYRRVVDGLAPTAEMEERLRRAVLERCGCRRRGRTAPLLAAAALALLAIFGTAMAADTGFRQEVFRLLRIPVAEQVPQTVDSSLQGDIQWVGSQTIGDAVTVTYIHLTENCDRENGILCCWQDEARTRADFYAVADEGLLPLTAQSLTVGVTWNDMDYPVNLQWAAWEDSLQVQPFGNQNWDVSYLEGRTDAVLLRLFRGRGEGEYAVLLDLSTGEVTDLFAGTGAEELTDVVAITLSSDLSRAIFSCDHGEQLYLCDLEKKTTAPVEVVLGGQVDGVWFIAEDTVGWYTMDEEYRYTCYVTDLDRGTTTLRFADQPAYQREKEQGVVFLGGRYLLEVLTGRQVEVLDLLTGARTPVADFSYPGGDSRTRINGAEDKILFLTMEMDGEGLGISELTVLDLERGMATALGREGYDVRHEAAVSWFDNRRVAISAVEEDGSQLLSLYCFAG